MDIAAAVRSFVTRQLCQNSSAGPIEDDTQLIDSGIVDSLGVMKLVAYIEEKILVSIAPDDLVPENFETAGKIATLVQARLPKD